MKIIWKKNVIVGSETHNNSNTNTNTHRPPHLLNRRQTRARPHTNARNDHASYLSMTAVAAWKSIQRRRTSHIADSSLATQYLIMRMCFCSVGWYVSFLFHYIHVVFDTHVLGELPESNICQKPMQRTN